MAIGTTQRKLNSITSVDNTKTTHQLKELSNKKELTNLSHPPQAETGGK